MSCSIGISRYFLPHSSSVMNTSRFNATPMQVSWLICRSATGCTANIIIVIIVPPFGNPMTYFAVIVKRYYFTEIKQDLIMLEMIHVAVVQRLQCLILLASCEAHKLLVALFLNPAACKFIMGIIYA